VCPWLRVPPLTSFLGFRSRSSFSFFFSWASGLSFCSAICPFQLSTHPYRDLAERSIRISTFEIVRLPDQEARSRAKSCAALSLVEPGKCSAVGRFPFLRRRSSDCERRVSASASVPTSVGLRGLIRLPLFDLGILVNRERVDSSVMNVREKVVVIMDCLLCRPSGKSPYRYHNIKQLPCFCLAT
jgi:hypothetical protein